MQHLDIWYIVTIGYQQDTQPYRSDPPVLLMLVESRLLLLPSLRLENEVSKIVDSILRMSPHGPR
jgi:hypothetical protein